MLTLKVKAFTYKEFPQKIVEHYLHRKTLISILFVAEKQCF